jgi:hypothetical protein
MHREREPVPAALKRPEPPTPIRLALRPDEAAKALGICAKSLRDLPDGPPVVRLGRSVLYRVASLDSWLAERERTPEDEPGPADDHPPSQ